MNSPIKVLIVDKDDSLRQRMRTVLESDDGLTIVGEAKDGEEALDFVQQTERGTQPDVILMEIDTPHNDNLQTVAQIRKSFLYIKIIVLNDDGQEELVLDAFRKGALGHLVKNQARPAEIVQAIRAVGRGQAILSPGIAGWMLDELTQKHKRRPGERGRKETKNADEKNN